MSHNEQKQVFCLQGPLSEKEINFGLECETDDEEEDELQLAIDCMRLIGSDLQLQAEKKHETKDTDGDNVMKKESIAVTDSEAEGNEGDEEDEESDDSKMHTTEAVPTFDTYEPQDEATDDHLRWLEEVLFYTHDKMRLLGRITKDVYRVQVFGDGKCINACLKIARKSQSRQSDKAPMELRVLSFLTHLPEKRNLQQLSHCFIGKHMYAFISPFMPSIYDLPDALTWNRQPEKIVHVMRDTLTALDVLHRHGIIHRDVKPSNIFWDGDHAVLADFGLCTWNTKKGHFSEVGTRAFMAPEVLAWARDSGKDAARYDYKSDLYSAGMTFGSLLFSMKEKHVEERHAQLFRTITSEYFAPHISRTVRALLEFRPEARVSAAEALSLLQM